MVFTGIFKRILGNEETPQISDNPFGDKGGALVEAVSTEASQQLAETPPILLHRDEIIDERGRIAGYRFYARTSNGGATSSGEFISLLRDEAVTATARRRLALIPITLDEWESHDYAQFATENTAYLLDAPRSEADAEAWPRIAAAIADAGARHALRDAALPTPAKALLPQARLFLIDFAAHDLSRFEGIVKTLRQHVPGLKLAADRITTWTERRLCLSLGIDYCLGGFASTPDEAEKNETINQSRLVLIEMLNLLRRDGELADLAKVAKRDPGVSLQVVAMANSPMAGLSTPVASLDQAIMVLGRESLYRWLTFSMFRTEPQRDKDEALLELALNRARFLELSAQGILPKAQAEELFLVGLLSVMDALLGMPMAKVLEQMHLPQEVQDVLLRSEGRYGRYLMLALAMEKGRSEQVAKLAEDLGMDFTALPAHSAAALQWAQEAMEHNRG